MPKTVSNNARTLRCPIPGDAAGHVCWDTGDPARGFDDTTPPNTYSGLELETIELGTEPAWQWSVSGPALDRMCLYIMKLTPTSPGLTTTPRMLFQIRHGIAGATKICVEGVIKAGQPLEPNLLVQVSGRLASWWEFWCCVDSAAPGALPVKMTMRALFDRGAAGTTQPNVIASVNTKLVTIITAE